MRIVAVGSAVLAALALSPALPAAAKSPDPGIDPGMAAAMRRDLELTDGQVAARLRTEAAAPAIEKQLRTELGSAFAGAWFPPGKDRLTVAVTSAATAGTIRSAGAEPVVVARSEAELNAAAVRLDRHRAKAPVGIRAYHVDPPTNSLVISVKPGTEAAARRWAADSDAGTVRVEPMARLPRASSANGDAFDKDAFDKDAFDKDAFDKAAAGKAAAAGDIRGGDGFNTNGAARCSIGFAVPGGFITAGHCGEVGATVTATNGSAMGTIESRSFPDNDFAFVRTNGNWTPRAVISAGNGTTVRVINTIVAAQGSSVCRSGRATGWLCGTVDTPNWRVNMGTDASPLYVDWITHAYVCGDLADEGGPFISGEQAQGVLVTSYQGGCSGGDWNQSWYQPVDEILDTFKLSLTVPDGIRKVIRSNWNDRCLDVPSSDFSDGVKLWMYTCNYSDAQQWAWQNGALRTSNNKCLDVPADTTDVALQIRTCDGGAAQRFDLTVDRELRHPQSGKCVDIGGWNPDDRAPVILWDCTAGDNQKWRMR